MGRCRNVVRVLFYVLLSVGVGTLWLNENTRKGDDFRHRPYWLRPLSSLPRIDLKPSWFLQGDEDELTKEAFSILLNDLNTEAVLTPVGKLLASAVLSNQLYQRSCIKTTASNLLPRPPVVILGLPRTGTTFLHGLLAANSDTFRAPRFHEYMDACPMPATSRHAPSVWMHDVKLSFFRAMAPKLTEIHSVKATTPEEDVVPLGQVFVSALYPTAFYVPQYLQYVQTRANFSHAVLQLTRVLGHLQQQQQQDRRWVLKTPWHLVHIRELVDHLHPHTQFVWMHRNPVLQATSLISTVFHMHGMASDRIKYKESRELIARSTVDFWYWVLDRAVRARVELNNTVLFVDVNCDDLRNQPFRIVEALYQKLGLEFSPQTALTLQAELKRNTHPHHAAVEAHFLENVGVNVKELTFRYDEIMKRLELNPVTIARTVVVAGFSSCGFFQRAVSLAKETALRNPQNFAPPRVMEFPSRVEYHEFLAVQPHAIKHRHATSPLVFFQDEDEFIGGFSDLSLLLKRK